MKLEHILVISWIQSLSGALNLPTMPSLTLDCAGNKVPQDGKYIPSLITLGRVNSTHFKVYLRCQQLDQEEGNPVQGEYVDVEEQFHYNGQDDMHYAKYLSMNCGDVRQSGMCFNPRITQNDLLNGMVCLKTGRAFCKNSMVVVSKDDRPSTSNASEIEASHWAFGIGGLIMGVVVVGVGIWYYNRRIDEQELQEGSQKKCRNVSCIMEEVEELKCKGQCNNPLESVAGSEWKQYDMYIAIGALILSVIFLSLWIRRERRQQQQQQQHQQQQRLPKPTGQKSNHELGPESQELESNYICEVVMDNDYYQRTVLANKNSSQESEGHYNENDYVAVL
ncbi:hypothetical protein TCAL_08199, partial [Tigriopus californicus]|eukprot:TCALIF_08199-PA protein Name:"Protein of unknown function" AED:0.41 eAED:0.41 QI:112/0.33/0.25/0.5/0.33/0.5/4/0/334